MKNNKILGIVNGKDEKKASTKPRTLDEIFGYDSFSNYKTTSEEEYEDSLRKMTLADLYDHCPEKGVLATDSRDRTIKRLLAAFREHKSKYFPVDPLPQNKMSKAKREMALKILRQ
jgi:hypothetical protein